MKNYFPSSLLDSIPADLLAVPAAVRALTGIDVVARPFAKELKAEHPHFADAEALIDIDPGARAITIFFDPERISASILAHELIHLRRDLLESVPKLAAAPGLPQEGRTDVWAVENEIEHLLIVPEQIAAFPEAEQWWTSVYASLRERIRGPGYTLLFAWSFIRNVLPRQDALARAYVELVNKHDFARQANNFRGDIGDAMPDKLRILQTYLDWNPAMRSQCVIGRYVVERGVLTFRYQDI